MARSRLDLFQESTQNLAEAYNKCLSEFDEKSQNVSPYSPNYWDSLGECWAKQEVGKKFRKVEEQVRKTVKGKD